MTIKQELKAELRDAMRSHDRARLDVIRQIETEVSKAASASGFSGEIDDDLYREVIAAFVKRMSKAREEFVAAGERGAAQAEKLAFEIDYLGRWLPQQASPDEVRDIVRAVIADLGASAPGDAGRVIGTIMKSRRDLDGAIVNRITREELGGS